MLVGGSPVLFSRDRRYLAYDERGRNLALWMVSYIAPELPVRAFITTLQGGTLRRRRLDPAVALSCLHVSTHALDCLPFRSQNFHRPTLQIFSCTAI